MLPRALPSRRNFLQLGALGLSSLAGLGPSPVFAASATAKAKRVLVLFEQGGVSHIDTWDPKPEAAAEHKSPHKPISTSVPGVFVTELLKQTSRHMDKLAIVRAMIQPTPGIGNSHPAGSQYVFSGEAPGGPEQMPDISSVVAQVIGSEAKYLPSNVMVPGGSEQVSTSSVGFLPPANKVFRTGGNPCDPAWTVPNLGLIGNIDAARFRDRTDLLSNLDVGIPGAKRVKDVQALGALRGQAEDMLTNPATRKAFDLKSEPEKLREAYGTGHRGQCYLLARKLIESGVRYVTVDCREPSSSWLAGKQVSYPGGGNMNWDHHDAIYSPDHTNKPGVSGAGGGRYGIATWPMMGSTDQALAALLDDMDQRGLLADTLVCFVTEFGRTPKINKSQGRDHWVHAFSFAFAGAGVRGGQTIGESDKDGGYVSSGKPYTLDDYAATIYEKLGIDRHKPIYTPANRPIMLARKGEAIAELL